MSVQNTVFISDLAVRLMPKLSSPGFGTDQSKYVHMASSDWMIPMCTHFLLHLRPKGLVGWRSELGTSFLPSLSP